MNTKNLFVSFLAIATILFLATSVSAGLTIDNVKVDDADVAGNDVSVVAGETITVEISFTSNVDASDVRIRAEIEGEKVDVLGVTNAFDVIANQVYPEKKITLQIPYELKDELSDNVALKVRIWNDDFRDKEGL